MMEYIRAPDQCMHAIQAWDHGSFQSFLDQAVRFDMKKLLACYEHCIAMDHSGKFNNILQHFPPQSVVRITECFRREWHRGDYRGKWTPQDFLQFDPSQKSSTG